MPSTWRRLLCRVLGHRYVLATAAGIFDFTVCARCGVLPYSRGGR